MRKNRGMKWVTHGWDPVTGCSKISPGCLHCMSEQSTGRWTQRVYDPTNHFAPTPWKEELRRPFADPIGRRILVSGLGDLFHEDIPREFIRQVLEVMRDAPQHTYFLLTKRPAMMRDCLLAADFWPLPNVNVGTSTENQKWFDIRMPILASIPVHENAVRYVSCEPLLGPIRIGRHRASLDWVIVGVERGSNKRPTDPSWITDLKQECHYSGIPIYHHRSKHQADLQLPMSKEGKMIKLLKGPIDGKKTYLEIDEELLTDLTGIEVQAGGESYVISFSKPPPEAPETPTAEQTKLERTVQIAKRTFGKLLRKTREDAGLSYKELAEASGLGKSTLSNYETGHSIPSEESLAALNAALGTVWVR